MNPLLALFFLPLAFVWLSGELFKSQQSHILRSGAYPNRAHQSGSTHFIEILAQEPLAALLIRVPSGLTVERVQATGEQFQIIPHTVTETSSGWLIELSLPIASGVSFTVSMQGVRSYNRAEKIWRYEVFAKSLNSLLFKPVGIAEIFVYSDSGLYQKVFDKTF